MGRFYANLAFDASVSASHANYLLRLVERLTYHQLVLLAFFAEAQSGRYAEPLALLLGEMAGTGQQPEPTLLVEMDDLADSGLLGFRQDSGQVTSPRATFGGGGFQLSSVHLAGLTRIAEKLHRLLELEQTPDADLADVMAELRGKASAEHDRTRA